MTGSAPPAPHDVTAALLCTVCCAASASERGFTALNASGGWQGYVPWTLPLPQRTKGRRRGRSLLPTAPHSASLVGVHPARVVVDAHGQVLRHRAFA